MKTIYNIRPKGMNVGNDAIAIAMQNFIFKACGELVNIVSIPATSKYDGGGLYGLTKRSIHEINQFADGVIVGGGNLYENGEIDIDQNALKALRVPLMVFSVSRGRIFSKQGELVERTDVISDTNLNAISMRADINLVRDTATVEYITGIGANATLGVCPTIFLNQMKNLFPMTEGVRQHNENSVIISVRNPDLMNVPPAYQRQSRLDIAELIGKFKQAGKVVRILCHDHRDIAFAKSFNEPWTFTSDVYTYLSLIRHAELVITYRLHSFLPALSFDTPVVKVSYDERAISLIADLGYDDWNINVMQGNVTDEVYGRLKSLQELGKLKVKNQALWSDFEQTIISKFSEFNSLMSNA
jgi:polysaccharide pyruvyl transferase WcaK-like protein